MAGGLTISTLNDSSGVLATQNGMKGIAKAWVNFQGGNGNTSGTIRDSFNVSSITVVGTGQWTINFTTAMPNANYAVSGTIAYSNASTRGSIWLEINGGTLATGSVGVNATSSASFFAVNTVTVAINGN